MRVQAHRQRAAPHGFHRDPNRVVLGKRERARREEEERERRRQGDFGSYSKQPSAEHPRARAREAPTPAAAAWDHPSRKWAPPSSALDRRLDPVTGSFVRVSGDTGKDPITPRNHLSGRRIGRSASSTCPRAGRQRGLRPSDPNQVCRQQSVPNASLLPPLRDKLQKNVSSHPAVGPVSGGKKN